MAYTFRELLPYLLLTPQQWQQIQKARSDQVTQSALTYFLQPHEAPDALMLRMMRRPGGHTDIKAALLPLYNAGIPINFAWAKNPLPSGPEWNHMRAWALRHPEFVKNLQKGTQPLGTAESRRILSDLSPYAYNNIIMGRPILEKVEGEDIPMEGGSSDQARSASGAAGGDSRSDILQNPELFSRSLTQISSLTPDISKQITRWQQENPGQNFIEALMNDRLDQTNMQAFNLADGETLSAPENAILKEALSNVTPSQYQSLVRDPSVLPLEFSRSTRRGASQEVRGRSGIESIYPREGVGATESKEEGDLMSKEGDEGEFFPSLPEGGDDDRSTVYGRGSRPTPKEIEEGVFQTSGRERHPEIGILESEIPNLRDLKKRATEYDIDLSHIRGYTPLEDVPQRKIVEEIKKQSRRWGVDPDIFARQYGNLKIRPLTRQQWDAQKSRVQGPYSASVPPERASPPRREITANDLRFSAGTVPNVPQFRLEAERDIMQTARDLSRKPHTPYPGETVADLSPEQLSAADLVERYLDRSPYDKYSDAAREQFREVADKEAYPEIKEDVEDASRSAQSYAKEYDDRLQKVIDRMYNREVRTYRDKVLRPLESSLIAKGQHYGGARSKLIQQSLDEFGGHLADKAAQMRYQGYENALKHAHTDLGRKLQAASLKGSTIARDQLSKLDAAKTLHRSAHEDKESKMKQADLLRIIGSEKRQLDQERRDRLREEFMRQESDPERRLAFYANIARGHNLPTGEFTTSSMPSQRPIMPSAYSVAGGLAQGIGSMLLGQGRAEGGMVGSEFNENEKKYLEEMASLAEDMHRNRRNPMWNFLAQMGFNMAAGTHPSFAVRMGQAAKDAYPVYMRGQDQSDDQRLKALNLRTKIAEARMLLDKQKSQEKLAREDRNIKNAYVKAQTDALRSRGEENPYQKLQAQMAMKQQFQRNQDVQDELTRRQELLSTIAEMSPRIAKNEKHLGPRGWWSSLSAPTEERQALEVEHGKLLEKYGALPDFKSKSGNLRVLAKTLPSPELNKKAYSQGLLSIAREQVNKLAKIRKEYPSSPDVILAHAKAKKELEQIRKNLRLSNE